MANNFLAFCPTDTGTNLLSQGDYAIAADRTVGNQPGVASSQLVNRAIRQSSYITSTMAQYMADRLGNDVLDNGSAAQLLQQLTGTLLPIAPRITAITSGTGTFYKRYFFFIASGNATAAATYTNSTFTFTVVTTIASGTLLEAIGTGQPAVSGTLTKSGGTGDTTLTYYAVRAPIMLGVEAIGGGGGGGGSSTLAASNGGYGGAGGNTTFGTTLIVASGGGRGGGAGAQNGDAGGAATFGSGPVGTAIQGARGTTGSIGQAINTNCAGSPGASAPFGGGGGGGRGIGEPGYAAIANTGAGGGGGGMPDTGATNAAGGGGSAGGYVNAYIYSPLASYTYAVGAAGTAGTAGTGGGAGGAGGSGYIIVTEYYQ